MITGSNNPFACTPVVVGTNNAILSLGTISRVDNAFTFGIGFQWRINSIVYANTSAVTLNILPTAPGFKRIDVAILNQSNQIELLSGQPSTTVALRPTIPVNAILLTSWNVEEENIDQGQQPIVGDLFVKKQEYATFTLAIADDPSTATIPLQPTGAKYYEINSVDGNLYVGFDTSLITEESEQLYRGKQFFIQNTSSVAITLVHNQTSFDGILFDLPNGSNLTVPPNGVVMLRYVPANNIGEVDTMKFVMASWVLETSLNQKIITISSSRSLTNADHNAIIRVTATATITIPTGLRSDFNAVFDTLTGAIATFSASGTTISAPSGLVLDPNKQCSLYATSLNNYRLVGGLKS